MTERNRFSSWLMFGLLLCCGGASAKDIFVATNGSDANPGDSPTTALRTIAAASSKAVAGDVVQILPGRYQEPIKPLRSGVSGKPITYRSQSSTHAVLTHTNNLGLVSAIHVAGVSHVVVDGIDIDGVGPRPNSKVQHFATISAAHHVVIRNGRFKYAHGWHGIAVEDGSSFVTIESNDIDWVGAYDNGHTANTDAGDAILIGKVGGARNILVRGNRISHAGHNLVALRGTGTLCVIEKNELDNSWRDVVGGDAGGRVAEIAGSDNLFQSNYVTGAGASSDVATNMMVKVEGANNIARHNVFANGNGEGISSSARSAEQPRATQLRIYNNTFYRIGGPAWRLEMFDAGTTVGDNVFLNNLVVDARMNPANPYSGADLVFKVALANAGPTARSTVLNNIISSTLSLQPKTLLQGFDGTLDLAVAQTKYPQLFDGNRSVRSLFVKANPVALADFDVASGNPSVDQGSFPATVVGSGRSNRLQVSDSRFFTDGFGLVPGDLIQLQGSTQRARVVQVDHAARVLQLDSALDFTAGRGVSFAFEGPAPDIGAREFGAASKPSPPTQVTVQ